MNLFSIIIYLLLSLHIGETSQQQRAYQDSFMGNGSIIDAHYVAGDPRFPTGYAPRPASATVQSVYPIFYVQVPMVEADPATLVFYGQKTPVASKTRARAKTN